MACEEAPLLMKTVAASVAPNITVLEKDTFDLPNGVRLIGCTLWSHVPNDAAMVVGFMINDYKAILTREGAPIGEPRRAKPADTNRLHAASVAWLEAELARAKAQGKRCIVCTHHSPAPETTKAGTKLGDPINTAFVSDQTRLMTNPPVFAWLYGHTHVSKRLSINGIDVTSNQVGYSGKEQSGFDPSLVYTFPT